MKKQKTNKVKTVVYLIHFILIDIWARNGVLHIFWGGVSCFYSFGEPLKTWTYAMLICIVYHVTLLYS